MAKRANYDERNKVVQAWYESGLSQEKYAQKIGMSLATLNSWTRKYSDETGENLVVKRNNEQKSRWFSVVEDWRDSCMSQENYAEEYGIELEELKKWIKKYQKEMQVKIEKVDYQKAEWFLEVEEWAASQMTIKEYVEDAALEEKEFKEWIKKYEKEHGIKLQQKHDTKERMYKLIDQYEQEHCSAAGFARSVGITEGCFTSWKRKYEKEYHVQLGVSVIQMPYTWEERFQFVEEWDLMLYGRKKFIRKIGVKENIFLYWVARYENVKKPLQNKEISLFVSIKAFVTDKIAFSKKEKNN